MIIYTVGMLFSMSSLQNTIPLVINKRGPVVEEISKMHCLFPAGVTKLCQECVGADCAVPVSVVVTQGYFGLSGNLLVQACRFHG